MFATYDCARRHLAIVGSGGVFSRPLSFSGGECHRWAACTFSPLEREQQNLARKAAWCDDSVRMGNVVRRYLV